MGIMSAGGSTLPDRNKVGKNDCIGMNSSYPAVALSVGANLQTTSALDGNTYVAMQPPKGEYNGESYVGVLKGDVVNLVKSEITSSVIDGMTVSQTQTSSYYSDTASQSFNVNTTITKGLMILAIQRDSTAVSLSGVTTSSGSLSRLNLTKHVNGDHKQILATYRMTNVSSGAKITISGCQVGFCAVYQIIKFS